MNNLTEKKKIMIILPRIHNNFVNIIKALNYEYQVHVFTNKNVPENFVEGTTIKEIENSFLSTILGFLSRKTIKLKFLTNNHSFYTLFKEINILKPDIIILRGVNQSMINLSILKHIFRFKLVIYNQKSAYVKPTSLYIIKAKLMKIFVTKYAFSPVLGSESEDCKEIFFKFIPFVTEKCHKKEKFYQGGRLNIITVTKFIPRKNILELMEVINSLKNYNIHLRIIGSLNNNRLEYYNKINSYIKENDIKDKISLDININSYKVNEFLKESDLFVLMSSKEPASYSQLEAISNSLPVIISVDNGTSYYAENLLNGYILENKDFKGVRDIIGFLIKNKEVLKNISLNSFEICRKYKINRFLKNFKLLIGE